MPKNWRLPRARVRRIRSPRPEMTVDLYLGPEVQILLWRFEVVFWFGHSYECGCDACRPF